MKKVSDRELVTGHGREVDRVCAGFHRLDGTLRI
jgi:hypothetical protein